jgi:hypothetical protein
VASAEHLRDAPKRKEPRQDCEAAEAQVEHDRWARWHPRSVSLTCLPRGNQVGDLIGLPVLDLNCSTLGYVRQVVRTPAGEIEFIVDYSRWWGWFGRPVAVPLEVLGIAGRQLVSLDMPPSEYAAASTWHDTGPHVCRPTQPCASRSLAAN